MKYSKRFKAILLFIVLINTSIIYTQNENAKSYDVNIASDGIQKIDVIVDSYSFKPDHIVVKVDQPVEIRLRSVTSIIPHNFTINYPEAGLEIDRDISSGEDETVTFIPNKVGKYEFFCNKKNIFANHKKRGMVGILEVVEQH